MKTKSVVLLVLMCVISMLFANTGSADVPLSLVSQNPNQIVLNFRTPQLEIKSIPGSNFQSLEMAGSQPTAQDGFPQLPMFSAWVAIPPRGDFTITVRNGSVTPKAQVLPLPASGDERQQPEIALDNIAYSSNSLYPGYAYQYSQPQIIRDFRVVQLNLFPIQYNAATHELQMIDGFEVQIDMNSNPGVNEVPDYSSYSSAFSKIYESMICNFSYYRDALSAPLASRILIIHGNSSDNTFLSKLAEFVAWKRQKGFEVNAVSVSQAGGSSNTAIKAYIQNQYNNTSTRPDFVILIGDVSGSFPVPTYFETYSSYNGEGDYPYTFLAGNDYLGDAFIGRLSAENVSQFDVLLTKIYAVEKNLNMTGTAAQWLNRMLLIGDPSTSGISCVYVNKFIRELSQSYHPTLEYIENYSGGYASTINSGINQGVSIFNYRGYYNTSGWNPSSSLVNGTKLPHAVVITCGTGDFADSTPGQSEAFMRLGTAASPAGALTTIGMATTGTHTMFNNCLTAGIFDGIFTYNMRTMGEALLNSRLYIKQVYGATFDNQANYFAHWANLMGDPTAEVFIGVPGQFTVLAPTTLPLGSNIVDISVLNSQALPIEDAAVTAFSNSQQIVIAKGWTDNEGNVTLTIPNGLQSDLLITISKHEFKPYQFNLLVDNQGSLVYQNKQIYDDNTNGSIGNGDGYVTAGETIAVNLEIKNSTAAAISIVTATVSTPDPYITVLNPSTTYPVLESGNTASALSCFTFSVNYDLPPVHDIRFQVQITDSNSIVYTVVFHVSSYNARLLVQGHTVSGGGNNILDPAEDGFLQVAIKNNSISAIDNIYAELRSLNDLLVVSDSLSFVGIIPAGGISNTVDGFEVFARALLIPGMQMPMRLRLYNDAGFEQIAEFNIPIGQVNINTPLGPDAYGYFIYDMSDTNFTDCPTYEWVEIHPSEGGSGQLITGFNDSGSSSEEGDQVGSVVLQSVQLPFAFPFYGIPYNQITVCINGFIAFGQTGNGEFRNYHLPGGYGPAPMIAAFWDDLIIISDAGIYKWYDVANHRFIIQYHKMRNGYNRTSLETFQVIFYDPLYHPTSLGDGMIKIQYKDFNNVDVGGGGYTPLHGNYCTIGIKDHTNTVGLEYTYNNQYPMAAAPLSSHKAILITTAPVLHENAFLVMDDVIINDTNGNSIVEPGETVDLGVKLINLGINTAQQVNLTATMNSDYASLTNGSSSYSDIPGDTSAVNHTPISVQIDLDCPNGTLIPIVCTVQIAGNSWQYAISLTVTKPAIEVSGFYMNDNSGNGNGLIDPGETLDLIVNYTNNSSLEAKNITSNIMSLSEFVSISNPSQLLPGIQPGTTYQAVYTMNVSPDVIVGNNLTFYLTYLGDLISPQNQQFVLSVGTTGMNEDFESDNGSFIANPVTGWEWGVSNIAGAHSGTKVWGTKLNSPYPANITYTLSTPSVYIGSNFMLEFWHKYNTEATYDGGNVKISTNNGSSWVLIYPEGGYTSTFLNILGGAGYDGNSGGWVPARFNLAAYANQNVRFRFTFASDGLYEDYGWYIDDVRTTGFVEFAGIVSGVVSSSNPDIDYTNVAVRNMQNWAVHPNTEGSYRLYLPIGSHQVKAEAEGYSSNPPVGLIMTLDNPIHVQDFYLGYFAPATALEYGVANGILHLSWTPPTNPEFTLTGYQVFRRINAGGFEQVANISDPYYVETLAELGTNYYYYVVCTYATGSSLPTEILHYTYSVEDQDNSNPPLVTQLMNNYPNPFNPETTIRFSLKEATPTRLYIYNLKGQLVSKLVDANLPGGMHQAIWNGKDKNNRNVASGMYFYRLEAGNYISTKKMLLLK